MQSNFNRLQKPNQMSEKIFDEQEVVLGIVGQYHVFDD